MHGQTLTRKCRYVQSCTIFFMHQSNGSRLKQTIILTRLRAVEVRASGLAAEGTVIEGMPEKWWLPSYPCERGGCFVFED